MCNAEPPARANKRQGTRRKFTEMEKDQGASSSLKITLQDRAQTKTKTKTSQEHESKTDQTKKMTNQDEDFKIA